MRNLDEFGLKTDLRLQFAFMIYTQLFTILNVPTGFLSALIELENLEFQTSD